MSGLVFGLTFDLDLRFDKLTHEQTPIFDKMAGEKKGILSPHIYFQKNGIRLRDYCRFGGFSFSDRLEHQACVTDCIFRQNDRRDHVQKYDHYFSNELATFKSCETLALMVRGETEEGPRIDRYIRTQFDGIEPRG